MATVNHKVKQCVEQFNNFLWKSSLPGHNINLHCTQHCTNILANNNFWRYASNDLLRIFACKLLHYTIFGRNTKCQLDLSTKKIF